MFVLHSVGLPRIDLLATEEGPKAAPFQLTLTMPFRQMKTLQNFSSVHASVHNHFNQERHLTDRQTYKAHRSAALAEWQTLMA